MRPFKLPPSSFELVTAGARSTVRKFQKEKKNHAHRYSYHISIPYTSMLWSVSREAYFAICARQVMMSIDFKTIGKYVYKMRMKHKHNRRFFRGGNFLCSYPNHANLAALVNRTTHVTVNATLVALIAAVTNNIIVTTNALIMTINPLVVVAVVATRIPLVPFVALPLLETRTTFTTLTAFTILAALTKYSRTLLPFFVSWSGRRPILPTILLYYIDS